MSYIPITPFRRAVDASVLEHQQYTSVPETHVSLNKWEILKELSTARKCFGLTDRELTVLQVLLSFHPEADLSTDGKELIVFPSNEAICARLNGMPCSTMRRQLSRLVRSGFVLRRDSPNGKRYARRYGDERVAFGFDLTPLLSRYDEICQAADAVRKEGDTYRRLKHSVSLLKRDLKGLADYGRMAHPDMGLWDACEDLCALASRGLRRSLPSDELEAWEEKLSEQMEQVRASLDQLEAKEMSTSDVSNEHHYQYSKIESLDSELCHEHGEGEDVVPGMGGSGSLNDAEPGEPTLPLPLVEKAAPDIVPYARSGIRSWRDLIGAAHDVHPMMGISGDAWQRAMKAMGPAHAAITLACILQRISEIRSPGGYLRALTAKAEAGKFSPGPMVMALLNTRSQKAAC